MEYEYYFKSKYTTLYISTTLDWKKMNEKQKMTRTQIPLGGMVKEPIRKDLLFLLAVIYNIRKLKLMHFGPCYLGSKGLQQACNKLKWKYGGGGSFREALVRPRVGNWAVSFSFLLDLLKNSEQSKSNVPTNTLKVFWVTTLVTKKNLSKILLSWGNLVLQKRTKLSLGSWLAVWEANEMCTFIAEYETLNYNKGN